MSHRLLFWLLLGSLPFLFFLGALPVLFSSEEPDPGPPPITRLEKITSAKPQPEVGKKRDEAQRKEVFLRYVEAERQARKDLERYRLRANDTKPRDSQWAHDLYKQPLAKKYGLTREELDAVGVEGRRKGWPTPSQ